MTFNNIIWIGPRALRLKGLTINNIAFISCEFYQSDSQEIMIKFDDINLYQNLVFQDCVFNSISLSTGSTTPWASFTFLKSSNSSNSKFIMNNVNLTGGLESEVANPLMELDIEGAENFQLFNAQVNKGATFYIKATNNLIVSQSHFEDTGLTITTSFNVLIENSLFSNIQF